MGLHDKGVLIAGGGIGGLATALALARAGIPSHVCERRPEFPEEGAGIQIGPNGVRALRALGAADLLGGHAASPDALSVREGGTGREVARLPLGQWIEERHGAPYWTAHRRDLHAALRSCAEREPQIKMSRGVEVVNIQSEGDRVLATSAEGEALDASVLVAADGLWSALRQKIGGGGAGQLRPRPTGKVAYRSVVEARHLPAGLLANSVHIWLAPGAHAVHYPVSGGREIALIVIADDPSAEAGWDIPASRATIQDHARKFAAPLASLVEAASAWRRWSLFAMQPLPRWTIGRAALLGDAAHPMLPFLAQGAVMALEDAISLARALSADRDGPTAALEAYERQRRRRVENVVRASSRNGGIYHLRGAAAQLRNATLKLLPPSWVMANFDWLYGWKP